jgi:hypothetical protein
MQLKVIMNLDNRTGYDQFQEWCEMLLKITFNISVISEKRIKVDFFEKVTKCPSFIKIAITTDMLK